jgi:hypothetical protein
MGHIFISYSHKDKKFVEKLEQKLLEEGFNVWIDHRIDYGFQWPKEIQKQLDACDAFIVVVSTNSYESKWVQNEVARADRKGKPFFPLLLQGDAWLAIEAFQYVDVTDGSLPPEKFYRRLEKVSPRKKVETPTQHAPAIKLEPKRWSKPPKQSSKSRIAVSVFVILVVGLIAIFGLPKLIGLISQIQIPAPELTLTSTATLMLNPTSTIVTVTKKPLTTDTLEPTQTPTPPPTQTMKIIPTTTATISNKDECDKVLIFSPVGPKTQIRIFNNTKAPLTLSLYLQKTLSGECGYKVYSIPKNDSIYTTFPQGTIYAYAWLLEPINDTVSGGPFRIANAEYEVSIDENTIELVSP